MFSFLLSAFLAIFCQSHRFIIGQRVFVTEVNQTTMNKQHVEITALLSNNSYKIEFDDKAIKIKISESLLESSGFGGNDISSLIAEFLGECCALKQVDKNHQNLIRRMMIHQISKDYQPLINCSDISATLIHDDFAHLSKTIYGDDVFYSFGVSNLLWRSHQILIRGQCQRQRRRPESSYPFAYLCIRVRDISGWLHETLWILVLVDTNRERDIDCRAFHGPNVNSYMFSFPALLNTAQTVGDIVNGKKIEFEFYNKKRKILVKADAKMSMVITRCIRFYFLENKINQALWALTVGVSNSFGFIYFASLIVALVLFILINLQRGRRH